MSVPESNDIWATIGAGGIGTALGIFGTICEFRFNPATDSDLMPAAVPI